MTIDRQRLYDETKDFFGLEGNAVMKLSRKAATAVCLSAAANGCLLVKLEGGIWNNGKFEARLDAIWDGLDPPIDPDRAHKNNLEAASFIRSRKSIYNAFIL